MSQVLTHWSKDFVEHLRVVHFGLISFSVGMIILVVSAKPYNSKIAEREMAELYRLQRVGSPAWLRTRPSGEKFMVDLPKPSHLSHGNLGNIPVRDEGGRPRQVQGTIYQNKETRDVVFVFPEDDWFQTTYVSSPHEDADKFPKTLLEFQDWWSYLYDPENHYISVDFVNDVWAEGDLTGLPEKSNYVDLHYGLVSNQTLKQVQLTKHLEAGRTGFMGHLPETNQEVFLYALRYEHVDASQGLLKSFFPDVCSGSFNDSFPDLRSATEEFATDPLDEIRKHVNEEAAKGADLFEAFGMKFPTDQITRWGAIVLLSIQIYFFLYLRQLAGKLSPSDAGWDVPWIAMDQSKAARVILFVTVTVLPCVAAASLAYLVSQQASPEYASAQGDCYRQGLLWRGWSHLLRVLVFLGAAVCAGVLGVWCWRYRPKVIEQKTGEQ